MKLFIPKIGTRLVLLKPWTFKMLDCYRNEIFWKSIHGAPTKKVYYYGYSGGYHTSATQSPSTPDKGTSPADPIDTTIPKGTVLFVESFHIQKGHEPQIALRIKKENITKIPSGKFVASIEDINKMEVEQEFILKYPNGRFTLSIGKGVDRETYKCKCGNYWECSCGLPKYVDHFLCWESDPDGSRYTKKSASVQHRTDTAGVDDIKKGYVSYRNRADYTKHFDTMEALLGWAKKKCFTDAHIDEFIKRQDEERIEWEKTKA